MVITVTLLTVLNELFWMVKFPYIFFREKGDRVMSEGVHVTIKIPIKCLGWL